MGSVGDSDDNALAETINGLYKAEFIHRRRLSIGVQSGPPIGSIPPAEVEERHYAILDEQLMAA